QSIFAHESTIHQLALSNDQRQACTGAQDGTIKIWDTQTWELIADMPTSKSLLTSMGWNADGSAVYWSTLDGELQTHRLAEAIARKKQQAMADLDKSAANSVPSSVPIATETPTLAESDQGPRSVATPQILTPP
ncbi:MAG: hypothetical protein ACKO9Q_18280, partial [Pirellula sp.]